jgi:hypothetical protein
VVVVNAQTFHHYCHYSSLFIIIHHYSSLFIIIHHYLIFLAESGSVSEISSNAETATPCTQETAKYHNLLSRLYLFSFTWSIGCNFVAPPDDKDYIYTPSASHYDLQQEHEEEQHIEIDQKTNKNPFDAFIRNIFHGHPNLEKIVPPRPHSVYDYFLDLDTEQFVLWQTLVPKADVLIQKALTQSVAIADSLYIADGAASLDDLGTQSLVPTRDTIRYGFLLALLLLNGQPVLLTGDVGVGKSILVEDVLLRLSKEFGK